MYATVVVGDIAPGAGVLYTVSSAVVSEYTSTTAACARVIMLIQYLLHEESSHVVATINNGFSSCTAPGGMLKSRVLLLISTHFTLA